ncbi:MAG: sigma-70 family RNA polymerase sigma factor [Verrucomicrobiales bacterium]|nr:sigma-70 family RNA polymerase sigma factor [Verrucomicrobiales bacterium]
MILIDMAMIGTEREPFPETKWTLVWQAQLGDSTAFRREAVTELCRLYWRPIYSYIRLRGHSPEDAEDLTQDFFARFLRLNHVDDLDAEKGRLRNYLLRAVKRHLASEWHRQHRQKRGGSLIGVSIDSAPIEAELGRIQAGESLTPEMAFDRQWALSLLDKVIDVLSEKYRSEGAIDHFFYLKDFIEPGSRAGRPQSAEVAAKLGMTPGAFRVAVHRLRQRYRETLLEMVTETLKPGENAEEELRYLLSSFS